MKSRGFIRGGNMGVWCEEGKEWVESKWGKT